MTSSQKGAVRLFRVFGIDVSLHWSWLVVAIYQIGQRQDEYSSLVWNIAEYLALFLMVLLHEFGHALACRQVGGRADQILLWPLGGVAYIAPPPRPGALLWSIVAGPLVNVLLLIPFGALAFASHSLDWANTLPDAAQLIRACLLINVGLLIFNLMPVYPLDGGQIVRALLWFRFGPGRSLSITAVIGALGGLALGVLALMGGSLWMGIIAGFILMRCYSAWKTARVMNEIVASPRRSGFRCPSCQTPPQVGTFWLCPRCNASFDTFETDAQCPACEAVFSTTQCLTCHQSTPVAAWRDDSTTSPNSVPPPLPDTQRP